MEGEKRRRPNGRFAFVVAALWATAGCRDVLGVTGYGLRKPKDAGVDGALADGAKRGNRNGQAPDAAGGRGADAGTEHPDAASCSVADAAKSCDACLRDKCPEDTCAGDDACNELRTCLSACDSEVSPACVASACSPTCAEACKGDDGAAWVSCRATCNLSVRRTTAASRLIACAARNCCQCSIAHPTHGGIASETCFEKPPASTIYTLSKELQDFAQNVDALELESCRQDCPAVYMDNPSLCSCPGYRSAVDAGVLLRDIGVGGYCYDGVADWSCLGHVAKVESGVQTVTLHVALVGLDNAGTPITNADVTQCRLPAFMDCGEKVDGGAGVANATFEFNASGPTSRAALLKVTWPEPDIIDAADSRSTVLLYFAPQVWRDETWTVRRLVSRSVADGFVKTLVGHEPYWGSRGGIAWSAVACNGVAAPDLVATLIDPQTGEEVRDEESDGGVEHLGPYYSDLQSIPNRMYDCTSSSGLGAYVDVPPGRYTFRLARDTNGPDAGGYCSGDAGALQPVAEYMDVPVEQGAITTIALSPTPLP